MKNLVTGATGFVGRCLVKALVEDGQEVRAFVRNTSDAGSQALGIEFVEGDLADRRFIETAVEGCGRVYHLAAQMLIGGLPKSKYFKANVEGTKSIVDVCKTAGLERFVLASTAGVYGVIKTPPVDETAPLHPSSAYRESKWKAEEIALDAFRSDKFPVVIARLPGLMGPGSMNWLGLAKAISAGSFRTIGDGKNHDHVAYVSDVVDGLRMCGEVSGIDGEIYNLAGQYASTVNEIVAIIARELGIRAPTAHIPRTPYHVYNRLSEVIYQLTGMELPGVHRYAIFLANKILDTSKARTQLGFEPKVSFETGMHQSIAWYKEQGLL